MKDRFQFYVKIYIHLNYSGLNPYNKYQNEVIRN